MLNAKFKNLLAILKKIESAVIAFSGGVDSTFLLKAVQLSRIKALAVTASSATMPKEAFQNAKKSAKEIGIKQIIIKTKELDKKEFRKNPPDRCYYCKNELFGKIKNIAVKKNYSYVLDGSNLDDMDDWRPGKKAACNHGVRSPLTEAGLRKKDIRELSRKLGLQTWDKPSSPCLASRFPYGEALSSKALAQVEKAEAFLRSLGFIEFRVRHHRDIARIELNKKDMLKLFSPKTRLAVSKHFKALGYRFISLDLEGFRSGRMNETLQS